MSSLRQEVHGLFKEDLPKDFAKKPQTYYGVVESTVETAAGQTLTAAIRTDEGIPLPGVPSGGRNLARGSRVKLSASGKTGGSGYSIVDVVGPTSGLFGVNPSAIIPTPNIARQATGLHDNRNGQNYFYLKLAIWQIEAQWRLGQRVRYVVEIQRTSDEQLVETIEVPEQGQRIGALRDELGSGDDTGFVVSSIFTTGPQPSHDFPIEFGVLELGNEVVYYETYGSDTTATLTRAQNTEEGLPTADVTHAAGTLVRGRSVTAKTTNLPGNTAYRYRVTAKIGTQASNPSDWFNVTIADNTVPPTWPVVPTPTGTPTDGGQIVEWLPASSDTAYYELQHANNISFLSATSVTTGSGNQWFVPLEVGSVRFVRVRPYNSDDYPGNWSNTGILRALPPDEPTGSNLPTNPTFVSNTNNWTLNSLGAASKNHDTSVYFDASGSLRIDESRAGIDRSWDVRSDAFTVTANTFTYVRVAIRMSGLTTAGDTITVALFKAGTSTAWSTQTFDASQVASATGAWTIVVIPCRVPAGETSAQLFLGAAIIAGSGTVKVWLDAVYVVQPTTVNFHRPEQSGGRFQIGGGATLEKVMVGSKTWDPTNLADAAVDSTTVTVDGAETRDFARASLDSIGANSVLLSAHVQAANTVRVVLMNKSGGALNIASGNLYVEVTKAR